MSSPCNSLNVIPIKVSKLVRYKNIDTNDFILTIESGSALYSRKSTFGDLVNFIKNITGSYSGSHSGSFYGKFIGNNSKVSGSFSGSYFGQVKSKNTIASGSFSGSYYGSVNSKNLKATGSFNGSIVSSNAKTTGSFYGSLVSSNTKATGSFNGMLVSSNTKASGSFSGSYYGKLFGKNAILSGSFSGSHYGKMIASKGSIFTGSFRGIDNITNFNGTGKKVSFNGTSSYSLSSSFSTTSSYVLNSGAGGNIFSNALYSSANPGTITFSGVEYTIGTITVPAGKTLRWFKIEGSVGTGEADQFYLYGALLNSTQITTNVYSSWGFGRYTKSTDEAGPSFSERQHFTIEGAVPSGVSTGTITVKINGSSGYSVGANMVAGYVVGYY